MSRKITCMRLHVVSLDEGTRNPSKSFRNKIMKRPFHPSWWPHIHNLDSQCPAWADPKKEGYRMPTHSLASSTTREIISSSVSIIWGGQSGFLENVTFEETEFGSPHISQNRRIPMNHIKSDKNDILVKLHFLWGALLIMSSDAKGLKGSEVLPKYVEQN